MPIFFFYGTLIDADVRAAVLDKFTDNGSVAPAQLEGWRRVGLHGRSYPVIVPSPDGTVDGIAASFAAGDEAPVTERLKSFEGVEYIMAAVTLTSGDTASVFVGSRRCHPTGRAWSFSNWERRHKRAFLTGIARGRLV
ncbi:unnamed protein product [Discosporangium mesarthrocarpum]